MVRIPRSTAPGARHRLLVLPVLLTTAAVTLAACGGGQSAEEAAAGGDEGGEEAPAFDGTYDGPAVELAYWNGFTGGDGPFMQDLVDQFNEEHENIAVTNNTVEWGDFYQRVPAAVNAGEGPDVGVMHLDQLATNAARNVIVPLDDLAEGLELTAEDFSEEVWSAGEYEGARYGIPLDVHSLAMYYNTEHFEAAGITEPPTNDEEFMAALDALQAAGYENPFWSPTLWPAHLIWLSLCWQNGGEPYGEDAADVAYDSPECVEALDWQRSMVEQGYSPEDVAQDTQYVAFKNGETSITWDGIWQVNDLDASGMPWAIAPVPTIGEEEAVWANSHNFFITSQAEEDPNKLEAAKVFIGWMSEQSGTWAQSGMIPARLSVRESGVLEDAPQAPIAEVIDTMRFLPPVPGLGQVQTETLEPAVAQGVLGNGSPEELLSQAASSGDELAQRNAEQFGG